MAGGWTRDGAVQDQIDDSVADAVALARAGLGDGPGRSHCALCGDPIPPARQRALPSARTCVSCAAEQDGARGHALFNRRGSKDSQLR